MLAQKGLRLHLGTQKYPEFETRFLAKTAQYPCLPKHEVTEARKGSWIKFVELGLRWLANVVSPSLRRAACRALD